MTCSQLVYNFYDLFMTCSPTNPDGSLEVNLLLKLIKLLKSLKILIILLSRLDLLITCSLLVHDLFTTCAQFVYDLFITCSGLGHNLFVTGSLVVITCS